MLFICFANVARSQVAEHISRCSHNMIAISHGIAVDHLIRHSNLPTRKLKHGPFPEANRHHQTSDGLPVAPDCNENAFSHFVWDTDKLVQ